MALLKSEIRNEFISELDKRERRIVELEEEVETSKISMLNIQDKLKSLNDKVTVLEIENSAKFDHGTWSNNIKCENKK